MVPTSIMVGLPTFLLLQGLTDLSWIACGAVALAASVTADVAIALWMESHAPTRVTIGPGEKFLKSELPGEKATVLSGFDGTSAGMVRVHGETWRARQKADDHRALSKGLQVSVIDRDNLTLIVSVHTH